jgi:hypothetical protein
VAHVTFDAVIFVTLFTVCWLATSCLEYLNSIHRFPPRVYTLAGRLGIWLFYLDCVLSGFVLAFTCVKFVIHTLEDDG